MPRSIQRSARQVAALIAEMMRRSHSVRMRLSDVDLGALSGRQKLDTAFRRRLHLESLKHDYLLYRLEGVEPMLATAVISLAWVYDAPLLARDEVFSDEEWLAIELGIFSAEGSRLVESGRTRGQ